MGATWSAVQQGLSCCCRRPETESSVEVRGTCCNRVVVRLEVPPEHVADVVREILSDVPRDSLTPHVLMTVLEDRHENRHVEVPVQHRPRRGDSEAGTMFGARDILIPKKLLIFLGGAFKQLVAFRKTI